MNPAIPSSCFAVLPPAIKNALAEAFGRFRGRLKRMVQLRWIGGYKGASIPSDVLQEAYLDLAKRAVDFLARPSLPFFLWLHLLTGQRLLAIHRQHLGTKMRDVGHEIALRHGAMPQATSASLAAQFRQALDALAGCRAGRNATPSSGGAQ